MNDSSAELWNRARECTVRKHEVWKNGQVVFSIQFKGKGNVRVFFTPKASENPFNCSCPDYKTRSRKPERCGLCKHILAVSLYTLQQQKDSSLRETSDAFEGFFRTSAVPFSLEYNKAKFSTDTTDAGLSKDSDGQFSSTLSTKVGVDTSVTPTVVPMDMLGLESTPKRARDDVLDEPTLKRFSCEFCDSVCKCTWTVATPVVHQILNMLSSEVLRRLRINEAANFKMAMVLEILAEQLYASYVAAVRHAPDWLDFRARSRGLQYEFLKTAQGTTSKDLIFKLEIRPTEDKQNDFSVLLDTVDAGQKRIVTSKFASDDAQEEVIKQITRSFRWCFRQLDSIEHMIASATQFADHPTKSR